MAAAQDAATAAASQPAPANRPAADGFFVGPWYAWWPGDPLPPLPPLPGFAAAPALDDGQLAALTGYPIAMIAARREAAHTPYLASLDGEPVACGWLASGTVEIGELALSFMLPPGDRYLWDFATLPAWRGRGIYPRLLQAILRDDAARARHWIGHEPDNVASARGIGKAGFRCVGNVYRRPAGHFLLVPTGPEERAQRGAALLGAALAAAPDAAEPSRC